MLIPKKMTKTSENSKNKILLHLKPEKLDEHPCLKFDMCPPPADLALIRIGAPGSAITRVKLITAIPVFFIIFLIPVWNTFAVV